MTATHTVTQTSETTYISRVPGAMIEDDGRRYDLEIRGPNASAWSTTLRNVSHQRAAETALIFIANGTEARLHRLDCPHPPHRVYCWFVDGDLCAACSDCGEVLKGGAA